MKRKIIILIVIIILGILGLIFIPRVYYATLFVHKDLNKIKLEPIEIYSDHMKYDGWSYSDNKDYKFPRYCYVYYAAKIKFPEKDIIIEENRIHYKYTPFDEYTHAVFYVNKKIDKEKIGEYFDYYLDLVHDNSCGNAHISDKKIIGNYYYVKYKPIEEC